MRVSHQYKLNITIVSSRYQSKSVHGKISASLPGVGRKGLELSYKMLSITKATVVGWMCVLELHTSKLRKVHSHDLLLSSLWKPLWKIYNAGETGPDQLRLLVF